MNIEQQLRFKKPYQKLGLSVGKKKTGGRNNQGRITAFHRGGGNKLRYIYINKSLLDIKKNTHNSVLQKRVNHSGESQVYNSGEVRYLVRDPNRTAWIAGIYWSPLCEKKKIDPQMGINRLSIHKDSELENVNSIFGGYKNLWYSYYSNMIAPEGITVGSIITNTQIPFSGKCSAESAIKINNKSVNEDKGALSGLSHTIGNKALLKDLMVGTLIHNIDGKYIRSAGCSGIIISKLGNQKSKLTKENVAPHSGEYPVAMKEDDIKVTVKLQSGQYKVFSGETIASIGVISNGEHKTKDFRKAGQKRWLGRRPIVRGVAMNPIDHPHGGGEGKSSGGRPSVTPWGKPTKGKPTRSPKKPKLER